MSFWDRTAALYDIGQLYNSSVNTKMAELTAQLVPEGARVLDTAAGTGTLTLAAAKGAAEVVCTDISLPMLRQAMAKAERKGIANVRFEARNIFHLEDDSYDVAMAGNVLHLLENPQGAVRELARVTKSGGLLILPTYMTGVKRYAALELYKMLGYESAHEYTPAEYKSMLQECNVGRVKARLLEGMIPNCFAVIKKY